MNGTANRAVVASAAPSAPKSPQVSVVVVNWNGLADTRECLASLRRNDYPNFEVHVVDNASEGDDATRLQHEFGDWIRLHRNSKNLGFAGGNNVALRAVLSESRAQYVALLNNDAIAAENWISAMVKEIEQDPTLGMVASRMLFYDEPDTIENAGVLLLSTGRAFPRGRRQPSVVFDEPTRVLAACAGGALYRARMLKSVGGFAEHFFLNFEDVDLSLRAQAMGWDCMYVPQAIVRHRLNRSIAKVRDDDFLIRSEKNQLYAYWVNTPWQVLALNLPLVVVSEAAIALFCPLIGLGKPLRLTWRAKVEAWRSRTMLLEARKRLAPKRKRGVWLRIWWRQSNPVFPYLRVLLEVGLLRRRKYYQ